jgi:ion channel POLLUX/CASTOR
MASIRERFRYKVDTFLAGGSKALFLSLAFSFAGSITGILLLRLGLAELADDDETSLRKHLWVSFLELTDPGNMSQDSDSEPIYKIAGVAAGFTGVVIFSSLIAFLTTALSDAITHLRKGHSRVLEEDHSLILGWGPRVVEILNELAIANESESEAVVAILSTESKEDMDENLRVHFSDRKTTRIVTRNGPTASLTSLEHVSASTAKSAIVLATCDAAADDEAKLESDANVVKTVLALASSVDADHPISIVAELFDPKNRGVVEDIAPGRVVVVDAEEILAKIMVQTSRTSGLAVVYSELLSFDGCEIYFYKGTWNGVTFGELQFRFADGVPIGLRRSDGRIEMRPPVGQVLAFDDEIIIVAQDDSSIEFKAQMVARPHEIIPPQRQVERRKERMLIVGWSAKAPLVIGEYGSYVLEGSSVDVVLAEPPDAIREEVARLSAAQASVEVRLIEANPLDRESLAGLQPFSYDTVIVLRQDPEGPPNAERIDAESIMVLLHLRRLRRDLPPGTWVGTKIITEVLDSQNQDLINRAGVDDFIISDRLVSMIFAQLSQEPRIKLVYDDLFEEAGSEIYVKPAWLYFDQLPANVRFCDLMRVAQNRSDEVCIGYKIKALDGDGDKNFGVSLVPPKDAMIQITHHDSLVVVAEDDR